MPAGASTLAEKGQTRSEPSSCFSTSGYVLQRSPLFSGKDLSSPLLKAYTPCMCHLSRLSANRQTDTVCPLCLQTGHWPSMRAVLAFPNGFSNYWMKMKSAIRKGWEQSGFFWIQQRAVMFFPSSYVSVLQISVRKIQCQWQVNSAYGSHEISANLMRFLTSICPQHENNILSSWNCNYIIYRLFHLHKPYYDAYWENTKQSLLSNWNTCCNGHLCHI